MNAWKMELMEWSRPDAGSRNDLSLTGGKMEVPDDLNDASPWQCGGPEVITLNVTRNKCPPGNAPVTPARCPEPRPGVPGRCPAQPGQARN